MKPTKTQLFVSALAVMTLIACGERGAQKRPTRGGGAAGKLGAPQKSAANDKKGTSTTTTTTTTTTDRVGLAGTIKVSGVIVKDGKIVDSITLGVPAASQNLSSAIDANMSKLLEGVSTLKTIYTENCDQDALDSLQVRMPEEKASAATDANFAFIKANTIVICGSLTAKAKRTSYVADTVVLADSRLSRQGLADSLISITANNLVLKGDNTIEVNALDKEATATAPVIELLVAKELSSKETGTLNLTSKGAEKSTATTTTADDSRWNTDKVVGEAGSGPKDGEGFE